MRMFSFHATARVMLYSLYYVVTCEPSPSVIVVAPTEHKRNHQALWCTENPHYGISSGLTWFTGF